MPLHILLLVIVMYGAIVALIISLTMIAFTIYKGNSVRPMTTICRKSEIYSILRDVPDDCIIEVWLGRNTYDTVPHRKAYGRDLRNYISE